MLSNTSWVTCFLTKKLIDYIEDTIGRNKLDYSKIIAAAEGFEKIRDPRAFLTDVNNWVPTSILVELIRECEMASGRKDAAYQAALHYFDPARKRTPSILEFIVKVLGDVRLVIYCSDLFAGAYTNHLKLQAFEKEGEDFQIYLLAKYNEEMQRPTVGGSLMIKGNYEGFIKLYPFVREAHCIEEFSQLGIKDIVQEFSNYAVETTGSRLIIKDTVSGQTIVEAEPIFLESEEVRLRRDPPFPSEALICPVSDHILTVLTSQVKASGIGEPGRKAMRITSGGVLQDRFGLQFTFQEGTIYNAPYFRYRFIWKEMTSLGGLSLHKGRGIIKWLLEYLKRQIMIFLRHIFFRGEIIRRLFDHLEDLKKTQQRMLGHTAELARLNRQIEDSNKRLKELDRSKSMFLSFVSHELRTPLTSIKGFAENMLDGITGELNIKQKDYLERIKSNTDRLTRMVNDLLNLSRIESGKTELSLVELSPSLVATDIVEHLRPLVAEKNLVIEIITTDPTLKAWVDHDKLSQIMTNLLDNAIKFTPAGGKIIIDIGCEGMEWALVSIKDTGKGIPQEDLSKIFDPFYQVKGLREAKVEGSGLGLTITKTLVELHGGKIWVKSETGKGSIFSFALPKNKQSYKMGSF